MSSRRARALTAAVTAGLAATLSACGVQPSDVVGVGSPASGGPPSMVVYYVRDGALQAAAVPFEGRPGVQAAIKLLLKGAWRAPGGGAAPPGGAIVTTALPYLDPAPVVTAEGTHATIRIAPPTGRLSDLAVRQLICTVGHARGAELVAGTVKGIDPYPAPPRVSVSVSGDGWRADGTDADCPPP